MAKNKKKLKRVKRKMAKKRLTRKKRKWVHRRLPLEEPTWKWGQVVLTASSKGGSLSKRTDLRKLISAWNLWRSATPPLCPSFRSTPVRSLCSSVVRDSRKKTIFQGSFNKKSSRSVKSWTSPLTTSKFITVKELSKLWNVARES